MGGGWKMHYLIIINIIYEYQILNIEKKVIGEFIPPHHPV